MNISGIKLFITINSDGTLSALATDDWSGRYGITFVPKLAKLTGISYSLYYLVLGVVIFSAFGSHLPAPSPLKYEVLTVYTA